MICRSRRDFGDVICLSTYETIVVDRQDRVATITLNRPDALNALNARVMAEVTAAAADLDADDGIGAIILTGSAKAFAAGADIKEMSSAVVCRRVLGRLLRGLGHSSPRCAHRPSPRWRATRSVAAASWR